MNAAGGGVGVVGAADGADCDVTAGWSHWMIDAGTVVAAAIAGFRYA